MAVFFMVDGKVAQRHNIRAAYGADLFGWLLAGMMVVMTADHPQSWGVDLREVACGVSEG